jgi:glycosyltransferase involved in cell wall biosynthesis
MPKLSIIVPTFNSVDRIERCLDSIASQSFNGYEVVIQDGASSDGTVEQVRRFREGHSSLEVRAVSERDNGHYDAMNRGMRRARGEWIYFLGSDDELHGDGVLEAMMQACDAADHDVVYGNVRVVGDANWAKNGDIYDGPFSLEKLLRKNICHQAIFYRSRLLRTIGEFNLNYRICADWDINLRSWAKTKFEYVDVVVANFYAGGISVGSDEQFNKDVASNVMRYLHLSILDPLLNTPAFVGFGDIGRMRGKTGSLRWIAGWTREFFGSSTDKQG